MSVSIKGIIPPMITPLAGEDELDVIGMKNLIEFIIKGGVHGVFKRLKSIYRN